MKSIEQKKFRERTDENGGGGGFSLAERLPKDLVEKLGTEYELDKLEESERRKAAEETVAAESFFKDVFDSLDKNMKNMESGPKPFQSENRNGKLDDEAYKSMLRAISGAKTRAELEGLRSEVIEKNKSLSRSFDSRMKELEIKEEVIDPAVENRIEQAGSEKSHKDLDALGFEVERQKGGETVRVKRYLETPSEEELKGFGLTDAGVRNVQQVTEEGSRAVAGAVKEKKAFISDQIAKEKEKRSRKAAESKMGKGESEKQAFDEAFSKAFEEIKKKISEAKNIRKLGALRKSGKDVEYRFFDLDVFSGYLNGVENSKRREEVFGKIREAGKELGILYDEKKRQLESIPVVKKKRGVYKRINRNPIDKDDAGRELGNNGGGTDPIDKDDAASEFINNKRRPRNHVVKPAEAGVSEREPARERTYEELEAIAEQDGAYYTLFGAVASGLRAMRGAVPGIVAEKEKYAGRIAEAIVMTMESSFTAVAGRLGWSDTEKKEFTEGIVRNGMEKFLK